MGNKYIVFVLTLLVNLAGALSFFHAFKDGTVAFIVSGVVGMVSLNMLAFLGAPLFTPKTPDTNKVQQPDNASSR